ncbi:arsenate reductase (azurin) small subunit [Sulfuracidifex tepidarius]|uniref:Rieske domain-containing protein n=1 Tax=Sulfuracidifex tepidarius TaxID=1294262 RepID=A0A510E4W9_9CREN|nr:arsenate reductase (azurin) small subunit [Sulfuracidifex tepidarius]BBG24786.1 hypothetical protein IC006_2120 [Sulfuracidifex tepidarius]BBG27572.1 hypothetical protein IC007_2126 [Sulfuracidifex tepidarius]
MSKGNDKDKVDPNRRAIVVGGAAAVAGIAAGIVIGGNVFPKLEKQTVTVKQPIVEKQTVTTTTPTPTVTQVQAYQKQKVANYNSLTVGSPVSVTYMGYPAYVVRTGKASIGGVGPNGDVVGYSAVCAHMGGPVQYDPNTNCGVCPYHYSQYDLTKDGIPVIGHPNQYLAMLVLEYDSSTGDIYALGFNRLVYGVYNNVGQASSSSSSS